MRKLVFRTEASTEMRRISRYTKREWNAEQARQYSAQLRKRIKSLREFPLRFPEVEGRSGIRAMRCGQHVVFYKVSNEAIEIVAIVHVAQDWEAWLRL